MKILIVNYRYFVSGGPERYMFNIIEELISRGHEIIPFSIKYTKNISSDYEKYFIDPLGSKDEVLFIEQKMTLKSVYRTCRRLFYDPDVERAVGNLISDTKPQIAYMLGFMKKMSPAVIVGIKNKGLPIIARLSDFGMLCPAGIFFRDNHPCELCIKGNIIPSIYYRCVKDSLPISCLNAAATWCHRAMGYYNLIDCFITPSRFLYNKMVLAGYSPGRLLLNPTFVDSNFFRPKIHEPSFEKPYFVYVGRIDYDKGVHVLLNAWQKLKKSEIGNTYQLKIAGTNGFGSDEYLKRLEAMGLPDVTFLGQLEKKQIADLLRNAYMSVVPSICYDNLPNTVLESFASGVPVITSDNGSFKECIIDGVTGLLFESGNSDKLAEKLAYIIKNQNLVDSMSKNAREIAISNYSPERHVVNLESLFDKVLYKQSKS